MSVWGSGAVFRDTLTHLGLLYALLLQVLSIIHPGHGCCPQPWHPQAPNHPLFWVHPQQERGFSPQSVRASPSPAAPLAWAQELMFPPHFGVPLCLLPWEMVLGALPISPCPIPSSLRGMPTPLMTPTPLTTPSPTSQQPRALIIFNPAPSPPEGAVWLRVGVPGVGGTSQTKQSWP